MLHGPREGLTDWGGGFFRVYHLHQVEQGGEVCAEVICCPLIFFLLPNALVFELRLHQLHSHLSDDF